MSDLSSKNFYEVLGVEKTADERTIKKAYFALVRKYPPETHAEEFKKIREAYEVLSDANSRQEYDSLGQYDEHGEEVSGRVREAMEAMDQERYDDARFILEDLLGKHPALAFVKDLLGVAHLRSKQPEQALALFEELVAAHPDNAAYHLHLGYANHALKNYPQAEAAYLAARKADGDDVRALVSLADCYTDQKKWDDAVRVLDEAIHLDGAVDFRDFALFLRKVEVEIGRQRPQAMTAVLAELMPIIPDDPAARKMVANRLASLAAPLFAQKRVNEANLLMREAAKLDPTRGSGHMPTSFVVDIERLPEPSKQWLIQQNKTRSFQKVNGSPYTLGVVLLLVGLGASFIPLMALFGNERGFHRDAVGANALTMGLFLAGALWLTAYSVVRLVAAAKSPYGAYTFVHPMFLLDVKIDQVTAWPLANLHDVRITHRHTNGVYNGSSIELIFATRTFTTTIYGKDQSVEWANHVLALRRRMLELMYSGMLEDATEETKLIPANLIPEDGKAPPRTPAQAATRKRNLKIYLGAVGAGIVGALISIPINLARADHTAYAQALTAYSDKIGALRRYLSDYPNGRHVDDANAHIRGLYELALTRAEKTQDAQLGPALVDLVKALKESGQTQVGVVYSSKTLFEDMKWDKLPADLQKSVVKPMGAFTEAANRSRERQMTQSLERAFDQALGAGLVTFVAGSSNTPVWFEVHYEVGLTGSIYESIQQPGQNSSLKGDEKFFGIAFFWKFGVSFQGEDEPRYTFSVDSESAKDIHWTSPGHSRSPTLPYDKMAESAFDDFKEGLAFRFGVASAKPRSASASDSEDDEDEEPAPPPPPKKKVPEPKRPAPRKH